MPVFVDLFYHIALLLGFTSIYQLLSPHFKRLQFSPTARIVVQGVVFGLLAILTMGIPFELEPGIIFDLRGIVIGIAVAFCGTVCGAIATLFTVIFRLSIGGLGTLPGLGAITLGFGVAVALNALLQYRRLQWNFVWFALLGLLLALETMGWVVMLPPETVHHVLTRSALPMLTIFPLASALFGSLLAYIHHQQDLANRYEAERAILRTLIDNVPDYIFVKDSQRRFILTNLAHAKAAGVAPQQLLNKTADEVFPPDLADKFDDDDRHVLNGESIIGEERQTVNPEGQPAWVLTTKVPLKNRNQQITGVIGISRDITHRKHVEQQRQQIIAAQQRIEVLQKFITDVSHDLRTPLTMIATSVYMLRRIADEQKRNERLDLIEEQTMRVSALLTDFLNIATLSKGEGEFHFAPFDMNAMIEDLLCASGYYGRLSKDRLRFSPTAETARLVGDEQHLRTVVQHLVDNALHFSDSSTPVIVSTSTTHQGLVIAVEDHGIGIPADEVEAIFAPLYRVDQARSITTGGSGLGLAFVQAIVNAHHGSIEVDSTFGQGSIFRVTLPLHQPQVLSSL